MVTATKDWAAVVNEIGPAFAERIVQHDQDDTFVQENYDDLRKAGLIGAGVPAELGGGDASVADLCEMLRTLAHYCSSTALALSMHTHLVAATAWRYRTQNAPVGPLLERVAKEGIVLVSTGGADWLDGSGVATKVEGGYKIDGRKIFCSGGPAGSVMLTMAVEQGANGPEVLHIPVLIGDGVTIHDNWRTIGMRGTGSNDITIEGVFVPDAAVAVRRPPGAWHPSMHLAAKIALPIVYAVYTGVAEAARDVALGLAAKRKEERDTQILAGAMENELLATRLAQGRLVELGMTADPGPETTNAAASARTLVARHAIQTVECAFELAGGAAFFRKAGFERLFRDIQAARFHPVREITQKAMTGRMAFGLGIDG